MNLADRRNEQIDYSGLSRYTSNVPSQVQTQDISLFPNFQSKDLFNTPLKTDSYGIGIGSLSPNLKETALAKVSPSQIGTDLPGYSVADGLPQNPAASPSFDMFSAKGAFGQNGWVSPLIGGVGALASGFAAMKQYGVAKDSLNFQKDAFNQNFAAQGRLTNASLERQQRQELAQHTPDQRQGMLSPQDYVKKYGVANV